MFILTGGLHQLRVQTVGDQRVGQIGEESLQRSSSSVHRHVHRHEVDAVIYRDTEREREFHFPPSAADSQGHFSCIFSLVSWQLQLKNASASQAQQTGKQLHPEELQDNRIKLRLSAGLVLSKSSSFTLKFFSGVQKHIAVCLWLYLFLHCPYNQSQMT